MVQSKKNSAKKSNATSSLQKDTPQNNFADFMKNEADQQTKNRVKKSVSWLDVVLDEQGNVKSKKVNSIRLSTRPDAIVIRSSFIIITPN